MMALVKFVCLYAGISVPHNVPPVIVQVSESGRCVTVAATPDSRVAPKLEIAPGPPPLLSFRYYEGKMHHRYSNSDLMLDDAGH